MKLIHPSKALRERADLRKELTALLERIEKTPRGHAVKGMYVGGLLDALESMGCDVADQQRVPAFRDYPLREYMELLVGGAITLYPNGTVQQGLRSLGQLGIPTFARSIVGGVIMGTVGRSWELALKCVSRGYEVSLKPGKAVVAEMTADRAVVQLRNVWNFGDSYQVGMIEGLMQWCNVQGTVTPHSISLCDIDLRIDIESKVAAQRATTARGSRPTASVG